MTFKLHLPDTSPETVKRFCNERDAVLRSLNEVEIRAFMDRWGANSHPIDDSFWVGVHLARVNMLDLSEAEKSISRQWLADNGVFNHEL